LRTSLDNIERRLDAHLQSPRCSTGS
jgi:hypothetical protein